MKIKPTIKNKIIVMSRETHEQVYSIHMKNRILNVHLLCILV